MSTDPTILRDRALQTSTRRHFIAAGSCLAAMPVAALSASERAPQSYLFCYFTDEDQSAGLRLATSKDGLAFEALQDGAVYLKPEVGEAGLMRDPCLFRGPGKDGPFHLVWTTAWKGKTIGHATSSDLIHWSTQQAIPVMKDFPTARYAWAPEGFWDAHNQQFLLHWSSSVDGLFSAASGTSEDGQTPRTFYTTTRDFLSFAPSRVLFDPGFSVIDASLMAGPGGSLWLLFKDERLHPLKKNIRIARAHSPTGPFNLRPARISAPWVEGPTGIWTGSEYRVYADAYHEKVMQLFRSRDLSSWRQTKISTPRGMKHGTIIRVQDELIAALR